MNTHVIIPAGGSGKRFGEGERKQFTQIQGEPMLNRVVRLFDEVGGISQIIVALPFDEFCRIQDESCPLYQSPRVNYVMGGITRSISVYQGFSHLQKCADHDVVLIHDAARPVIDGDLIRRVISSTPKMGAVIPVVPVADTIKEVDSDDVVVKTVNRDRLRSVQTPQGFLYSHLRKAYNTLDFKSETFTDEAMLMEALGIKVATVHGDPHNIKVTTPFDLQIVEELLKQRIEERIGCSQTHVVSV